MSSATVTVVRQAGVLENTADIAMAAATGVALARKGATVRITVPGGAITLTPPPTPGGPPTITTEQQHTLFDDQPSFELRRLTRAVANHTHPTRRHPS